MPRPELIAYFPKITPKRFRELASAFASLGDAWTANRQILMTSGWDEMLADEFINWRDKLDEIKIENELKKEQIKIILSTDKDYPKLLNQLYDPPVALFVRGELSAGENQSIAVVGTRKCTAYGKQVTEDLVPKLVSAGLTVVSGLALGIDGIAHEATLRAHGKTIAVLGSGVNQSHVFPSTHNDLANRIVSQGGAIVSEYPPGTSPNTFTFPRRNRIIAGLTGATLVIEAPESSGALITAQCALDNNRDVFAVPQNITSETSVGPNTLIKNGAHPVTSIEDILSVLKIEEKKSQTTVKNLLPETPEEESLLKVLTREPQHIDTITKSARLPAHIVAGNLTLMEMKGMVRNVGGMMYVIVS
jgi:DNA processing protein